MAERDLTRLLQGMEPVLDSAAFGFAVAGPDTPALPTFATVTEAEGLTLVAELAALEAAGLSSEPWARISLTVHSDLSAVGLTAAFATKLADVGVSANVIAGFYHDHIFVPWDRRHVAMAALLELSRA